MLMRFAAILRLARSACLHRCSLLLLLLQAHLLLLQIVKTLAAAGNRKRVSAIINKLVEEFAFSPQVGATSGKQERLHKCGEAGQHWLVQMDSAVSPQVKPAASKPRSSTGLEASVKPACSQCILPCCG